MLRVAGEHDDFAGEVGAAGTAPDAHALHRQVGMRMQQLRQHPLDFHPRCVPIELDARGGSPLKKRQHLGLELGVCSGGVQIGKQVGHRRGGGK